MAAQFFQCPGCGGPVSYSATVCPRCGWGLARPPNQWPQQTAPSVGGAVKHGFGWGLGCLLVPIALIVGLIGVGAIANSVTPKPTPTTPTPSPLPTVTVAPAPTPAPATPTPSLAVLSFGKLKYTSNACFERFEDAQGHTVWGAMIDLSLTATNGGTGPSDPVWLVVQPSGLIGSAITATSKMQAYSYSGLGIALEGPSVAAGKSATLAASLFFEVSYRADFEVYVSTSSSSSRSALLAGELGRWSDVWTSVTVC